MQRQEPQAHYTGEIDLLAELIDDEPSQDQLVLERPDWNMNKLTRPFLRSYRAIEDASWAADQWARETSQALKKIVSELPQEWTAQGNDHIMGNIFGKFFTISQQYSVSMYMEIFAPLTDIAKTFASHVVIETQHSCYRKIPLREIALYWFNFEHHYQMRGTLREAGDMYFVFLRTLQRFFYFRPKDKTTEICQELLNDVDQLCENLIKSHRAHLSYLYYGLQDELYRCAYSLSYHQRHYQIRWKLKKLPKLQHNEKVKLERYEEAIEKMLEGFHLYLRCIQMQLNLKNTAFFEINTFETQKQKIQNVLKKTLSTTSNFLQKIKDNEDQHWTYQECSQKIIKIENFFYREITDMTRVFRLVKENPRTNNFPKLISGKYDFIAQSLPEHADIIHFQRLWSWSKSKIEVDVATPLRFPAEQFFLQRVEKIVPIHQQWLDAIAKWLKKLEQQEQFFKLSVHVTLQEWEHDSSDQRLLSPEEFYQILHHSSIPFENQVRQILAESDTEFYKFQSQVQTIINDLIIDFRNLIFDPEMRSEFLRPTLQGKNIQEFFKKFIVQLQYTKLFKQYRSLRWIWKINKSIWLKWRKIKISWHTYDIAKTHAIPDYYSHVFVPEILEVSSLFIGRTQELAQLKNWASAAKSKQRQMIALFGVPGVGIRSLVEHFTKKYHYHLVKVRLTFQDEHLQLLKDENELQIDDFLKRLDTDQMQVVSLQIMDHSLIENIQSIHALHQLLQQLHQTPTSHLYLFHIHEFVWKSLACIPKIKQMFKEVKQIGSMDQATLKQLIYQRHSVVGYSLDFIFPKKRSYYLFHKIAPNLCQRFVENIFFNELKRRSQGNPAIAMQLWIHQCRASNKRILLMPFKQQKSCQLGQDELLILRMILTQGAVSLQSLKKNRLIQNLQICIHYLNEHSLIRIKDSILTINPQSYQVIYQSLKQSALLQ